MLALLCACHVPATSRQPEPPVAAIHTVASSPAGISANAYLVEGATALVVVDSALTVSEAAKVRAQADALGKPLAAVLHDSSAPGVGRSKLASQVERTPPTVTGRASRPPCWPEES